ncbi:MAG: hypothetical protein M3452_11250, partial [Chloroflexota bacterium]|nr:hypothetical protein [Chloroflexota bacterium]
MTDEAYREIVALRARIAELEVMAATMTKGVPMNSEPTPEEVQQRLRADAWRFDPQLEQVVERL